MRFRSRYELFASILGSIAKNNEGVGVTKIMYESYVAYNTLRLYLSELSASGLIEYKGKPKTFTITQKGHRFLEVYNEIDKLVF